MKGQSPPRFRQFIAQGALAYEGQTAGLLIGAQGADACGQTAIAMSPYRSTSGSRVSSRSGSAIA